MKKLIILIFFILVATLATGFYLRFSGAVTLGDRFIGLTILTAIFVLMPMFLYHRWKDRNVKDYMLSEDNIKKMRDFNESKERKRS